MKVKTSELRKDIKIRIFANLNGCECTQMLIENKILNTPFKYWKLDEFNVIDLGNGEVADVFIYESLNKLIVNVNDIF